MSVSTKRSGAMRSNKNSNVSRRKSKYKNIQILKEYKERCETLKDEPELVELCDGGDSFLGGGFDNFSFGFGCGCGRGGLDSLQPMDKGPSFYSIISINFE